MRLIAIAAMLGLATPVFPQLSGSYPVWYNELYDQGSTPLTSVACSGGLNGVITMGYETFSDLPSNRGVQLVLLRHLLANDLHIPKRPGHVSLVHSHR